MDSDYEGRPLLRPFINSSRRRYCKNVPKEVIVTVSVIGLFVSVITFLVVFENHRPSNHSPPLIVENLLASSLKSNKHEDYNPSSVKPKFSTESETVGVKNTFIKKIDQVERWFKTLLGKPIKDKEKNKDDYGKESYRTSYYKNKEDKAQHWIKDTYSKTSSFDYGYTEETSVLKDTTLEGKDTTYNDVEENKEKIRFMIKGWKKSLKDSPEPEINERDREIINGLLENLEEILEEKPSGQALDNFYDSTSEISLKNILGSPYKYNKKASYKRGTESTQVEDYRFKNKNYVKDYKKPYDVYAAKQVFSERVENNLLASTFNGYNKTYSNKEDYVKFPVSPDARKYDKVIKGWKKISTGSSQNIPSDIGTILLQLSSFPQSQINCAYISEQARKELGNCVDLSFLPRECKHKGDTKCFSSYKYRKIDGTCSNQKHPTWGKSGTAYVRMLAPEYGDGVSSFKSSKSGNSLPNPQLISEKLSSMQQINDASLLFTAFYLLIKSDISDIGTDDKPCCDIPLQSRSKECMPIELSMSSSSKETKCLNYVRSVPIHGECGRREQLNTATSFLDGSVIYGSNMRDMKALRTFNKGQIKAKSGFELGSDCEKKFDASNCLLEDGKDLNLLNLFAAMKTLWLSEHNRIALELHKLNNQWTDETLFQETKRIVAAEIQHITYNEFLPLLLGENNMDKFQLNIEDKKYFEGYDDTINPGVYNVFAATSLQISTIFSQLQDKYDYDVATIGIQRTRDHGIPSYTKWRSVCNLTKINSWEDLESVTNKENANVIQDIYESVDDIDLIAGGLAEPFLEGSMLGPTFSCIIGRQFMKIRKGDRFWYGIQNQKESFTNDQLEEIHKISASSMICSNIKNLQEIQREVFKSLSAGNSITDCKELTQMNLSKWIEKY